MVDLLAPANTSTSTRRINNHANLYALIRRNGVRPIPTNEQRKRLKQTNYAAKPTASRLEAIKNRFGPTLAYIVRLKKRMDEQALSVSRGNHLFVKASFANGDNRSNPFGIFAWEWHHSAGYIVGFCEICRESVAIHGPPIEFIDNPNDIARF